MLGQVQSFNHLVSGRKRFSRRRFLAFGGAALASIALASGMKPAAAESVLAMHIEEQTSWVQNFNPFDLGGRRQSTMDFVYEPLVIFNDYDGGKPIFRLATGTNSPTT